MRVVIRLVSVHIDGSFFVLSPFAGKKTPFSALRVLARKTMAASLCYFFVCLDLIFVFLAFYMCVYLQRGSGAVTARAVTALLSLSWKVLVFWF